MPRNNHNTMTANEGPDESVLLAWGADEFRARAEKQSQPVATAKLQPLEECPDCRYPLNGLPTHYHCPECGFEYDEDTYCWKYPGSTPASIAWLIIVSVALLGVMSTSQTLNLARWSYQVAFLVLALVILVSRLHRQWKRWSMLVTAPSGIVFREVSGDLLIIPYETIDWICVEGPRSDRCVIHANAGAALVHDLTCYVKPDASRFCSIVQKRIAKTRKKEATP